MGLLDAFRRAPAIPAPPPRPGGATIVQLSVSPGGVPKRAVDSAHVTRLGLAGDAQRNLVHHGGVERAVCLYSLEVIDALRAEGHPIAPGSTGENITIAGLDWSRLHAGARLALGGEVVLAITRDCTPCRTIMGAFHDRKFGRISHRTHPGWSRFYAAVEREGTVRTGDAVLLTPADRESPRAAP